MKLSRTSEYAIRILSFMAQNPDKKYAAKYLVKELEISDKYLRRILTKLSKEGLIISVRGRDGGYTFHKKTQEIFLSDIINASEGMERYLGCILGFEECSDHNPCAFHRSWVKVRAEITTHFSTTSLADIKTEKKLKFPNN
ncbi:MAG: transcriptional regulator [Bacteroidetes bacterium 4572_77]|nr:MAG: transcriptional regulator [Bacteroidetes bacterium 4572_77]